MGFKVGNLENRHECRFTMLELLVATVILMLMLTMLFAAATAITASWERLNHEKDHFMAVMAIDRMLDNTLSNIVPLQWRDSENNQVLAFHGAPEQAAFFYRHRLNRIEDGALRNVILLVDNGKLLATYQERPHLDLQRQPGPRADTVVLAEGIERIRIFYADWQENQGIEWVDYWNENGERLEVPLALRIDVFWLNGYQESWLRRTAGNGFDEQLGIWRPRRD